MSARQARHRRHSGIVWPSRQYLTSSPSSAGRLNIADSSALRQSRKRLLPISSRVRIEPVSTQLSTQASTSVLPGYGWWCRTVGDVNAMQTSLPPFSTFFLAIARYLPDLSSKDLLYLPADVV